MKNNKSVGVVIPTWNSKHHLKNCLGPLLASSLKPKILVIDSASTDGTLEAAKELGCLTHRIEKHEFNHGLTREKARNLLGTDIVVMMTDDAYPVDHTLLEKLVSPIMEEKASISYARQLPRLGAGFFEAFPRDFNYPLVSHIRSLSDVDRFGTYTFFCSNSCAAYLNSALDEIGGFSDVLFGEDTVAVAKLLRRGHKMAYVAESLVRHSHCYSLRQEFQRYFDIGAARKSYGDLIACKLSDQNRGASFFKEMMKRLIREKPYLLPYAIFNTSAKFLGYCLGKQSAFLPFFIKRKFSSQKYYWKKESRPAGSL